MKWEKCACAFKLHHKSVDRAVCRMAERKIHVPGGSILAHHASEALQSRELRVAVDAARTLSFSCFVCTAMLSLSKVTQALFCVSRSYVYTSSFLHFAILFCSTAGMAGSSTAVASTARSLSQEAATNGAVSAIRCFS